MKIEFSQQIFGKFRNIKFLWEFVWREPSCSMPTDGRTDRHDATNNRFSQFCERASKRACHLTVRRDFIVLCCFRLPYCGIWWSYNYGSYGFAVTTAGTAGNSVTMETWPW